MRTMQHCVIEAAGLFLFLGQLYGASVRDLSVPRVSNTENDKSLRNDNNKKAKLFLSLLVDPPALAAT